MLIPSARKVVLPQLCGTAVWKRIYIFCMFGRSDFNWLSVSLLQSGYLMHSHKKIDCIWL